MNIKKHLTTFDKAEEKWLEPPDDEDELDFNSDDYEPDIPDPMDSDYDGPYDNCKYY